MTRQPPPAPSIELICAMEIPAATLMMSVFGVIADAMLAIADDNTYGFTARINTSAFRATSELSRVQCTPVSAIALRGPEGHETHTEFGSQEPAAIRPRTSALAMFPAPITPKRNSRDILEMRTGVLSRRRLRERKIIVYAAT